MNEEFASALEERSKLSKLWLKSEEEKLEANRKLSKITYDLEELTVQVIL